MIPRMIQRVDIIYAVKRKVTVQLLYYCPRCESTNEIRVDEKLDSLICHDCRAEVSAVSATIEGITPPSDEQ